MNPHGFLHKIPSRYAQLVPHADRVFPALSWKPGPAKMDFPAVFERDQIELRQRDLKRTGWQIEDGSGRDLLERLHKSGTTLLQYCDGRIYNGIKTGHSESFVLDRETRDRLVEEDAASSDLLKPFLRGRDIKRWRCESEDHWLIYVPWHCPLQADESITAASLAAEKELKKRYPAIYRHLSRTKMNLAKRDQAETGIRYEWYALARPRYESRDEFCKPKIVVPCIQNNVHYAPDLSGYLSNDKTSIVVPPSVNYALAILNSPISWWISQKEFPSKQGGFFEFKPAYVSNLPIPAATPMQRVLCEQLASALIELHKPEVARLPERELMISWYQQWLNGLVYELFFPAELDARRIHLFEASGRAENRVPSLDQHMTHEKLALLKACFHRVYDIKHPIREMLFALRSIGQVRTVEGEKG